MCASKGRELNLERKLARPPIIIYICNVYEKRREIVDEKRPPLNLKTKKKGMLPNKKRTLKDRKYTMT